MPKKILFIIFFSLIGSACSDLETLKIVEAVPIKDEGFRYDPFSGECTKDGIVGSNPGLGECGTISEKDLSGEDFSGRNLMGLSVIDSDFTDADFSKANLAGAHFENSTFTRANFSEANLDRSRIRDSRFNRADLRDATAYRADVKGSNFLEADFRGFESDILFSLLDKSNLVGRVTFDVTTRVPYTVNDLIDRGMFFLDLDGNFASRNEPAWSHFKYNPSLSFGIRQLLTQDFEFLSKIQFGYDDYLSWIFGGYPNYDFKSFFNQRFHTFFSRPSSREELDPWASNAANFYLEEIKSNRPFKRVMVGKQSFMVDRSGKGIIFIYDLHTHLSRGPLPRLSVMAHEARHTDCPEIPKAKYSEAEEPEVKKVSQRCFNTHQLCPLNKFFTSISLAGLPACDAHSWGAYSVGYAFSRGVARHCQNCSESDLQEALASAADSLSRVLDKDFRERLASGSPLDSPNMTTLPNNAPSFVGK